MSVPILYHQFRWNPAAGDNVVYRSDGMEVSFDLWKVDVDNKRVENISESLVGGSVTLDVTRPIPLSASFTLKDPAQIISYVDYLAPFINIDYADRDESIHEQLGIFCTKIPPGTYTVEDAEGTLECGDLCEILSTDKFHKAWSIAAGANVVDSIGDIIESAGINRWVIPPSSRTLPKKRTFHTDSPKIDAVNSLLKSIGYDEIYTSRNGYLKSPGASKPIRVQKPWAELTTDDVYTPIEVVPTDDGRLANVVIVTATDQDGGKLKRILINDDPKSVTSTVSLDRRFVKSEQMSGKVTLADVTARAEKLLAQGRSYFRTVSFGILPTDEVFEAHQTIEMDLLGKAEPFSGRWWITGATINFTPGDSLVTLTLNQLTRSGLATEL